MSKFIKTQKNSLSHLVDGDNEMVDLYLCVDSRIPIAYIIDVYPSPDPVCTVFFRNDLKMGVTVNESAESIVKKINEGAFVSKEFSI